MIPDYQTIMLPLLEFAGDKKEHHIRAAIDYLIEKFSLSIEERKMLLPSGQQPIFDSRVGWARTYLVKGGLLYSPKRGYFKITKRGLDVLQNPPTKIDNEYLSRFPEFIEFTTKKKTQKEDEIKQLKKYDESTPEDLITLGYQKLRQELTIELLDKIMSCPPNFFEKLVVDLLVEMGYGGSREEAGKAVGKSGDEGIDGIIKEDKLGLDIVYIQAKRWSNSVGRPEIQKFVGALHGQRAKKGIFVTTSSFSQSAIDYVSKIDSKIILIDGEKLADLMIDYNVGISTISSYKIKRIDLDYFMED